MNRLFKNRNSRDKNYCLYVSSDSIIKTITKSSIYYMWLNSLETHMFLREGGEAEGD